VEEYTLRYGNGNADRCLRTACFVGKGNVLTLRDRIDRMLYVIQSGCVVPNVLTPPEYRKEDAEKGVHFQSVLEILYEICVGDVSGKVWRVGYFQ
jgi:hypothetical protein